MPVMSAGVGAGAVAGPQGVHALACSAPPVWAASEVVCGVRNEAQARTAPTAVIVGRRAARRRTRRESYGVPRLVGPNAMATAVIAASPRAEPTW